MNSYNNNPYLCKNKIGDRVTEHNTLWDTIYLSAEKYL